MAEAAKQKIDRDLKRTHTAVEKHRQNCEYFKIENLFPHASLSPGGDINKI